MSNELTDARARVAQLESDQSRFKLPDNVTVGNVVPHDYETGVRYGLVVETEPEVKVVWLPGSASPVDHLLQDGD